MGGWENIAYLCVSMMQSGGTANTESKKDKERERDRTWVNTHVQYVFPRRRAAAVHAQDPASAFPQLFETLYTLRSYGLLFVALPPLPF